MDNRDNRCPGCGINVVEYENGIDCPECHRCFCDSCYNTQLGDDGCDCHLTPLSDAEREEDDILK